MKFNLDGSVADPEPDPVEVQDPQPVLISHDESWQRHDALKLAIAWCDDIEDITEADEVVAAAETFLAFLTGKEKPDE